MCLDQTVYFLTSFGQENSLDDETSTGVCINFYVQSMHGKPLQS